jgi:hypothetical protein
MRNRYRILVGAASIACLFVLATVISWPALAECDPESGCSTCCPKCKLSVSSEEIKKHFYRVECKTICIPKVTFPWQKPCCIGCDGGCDGGCCDCPIPCKGAHLRTIKVLRKFAYQCERCKYKWTPECLSCDCDVRADDGEETTAQKFAPPLPPDDFTTRVRDLLESAQLRK